MSRKASQQRICFMAVVFVIALTGLSARLIYLQVFKADYYVARMGSAETVFLPAMRGSIMDRNGALLACDQPVRSVVADLEHLAYLPYARVAVAHAEGVKTSEIKKRYEDDKEGLRKRYLEVVSTALESWLGTPAAEIEKKLTESRWQVQLNRGMPEDLATKLEAYLKEQKIRGILCRHAMDRYYPSDKRLTHVLGFVKQGGVDSNGIERSGEGVAGVEKVMSIQLAGKDGKREVQRDGKRREVVSRRGGAVEPRHGNSLALTVDMGLQQIVEEVMEEAMEVYNPEKISVVLIRPDTGEVLAMSSRPDFSRATGEGNRRNYAVSDVYEPGSTFKLITFAGAFEHGLVSPESTIFCHDGSFRSDDGHVDLKDHGYYGNLTVREVLAKSSNIGTYMLARKLGAQRFHSMIQSFGFGAETGIQLTGEEGGVIRPLEKWSATSLSRLQMGYEVSVTPLQMASAVATIANGGMLYQPTLIHQWKNNENEVLRPFQPRPVRRVMSERAAAQVASCMLSVVGEKGTGKRAALERWQVAGKTGTTQKYVEEESGYSLGRYVVSFAGFVPFENPEFAGVVVVDDPKNEADARYGGTVAAPLFAEIARRAMESLEVAPGGSTAPQEMNAPIPLAVIPESEPADEPGVLKAQKVVGANLPVLRAQIVVEEEIEAQRQPAQIPRARIVDPMDQPAVAPRAVPVLATGGELRAVPYHGREAAP